MSLNNEIFPKSKRNPYYIYASPYARTSAGIKVLHLLCHSLNKIGESAFVTTETVNPELLTPVLSKEIVDYHFQNGMTPIVIYPEIVFGNPMNARVVVRYLLNFPGLISGPTSYNESDICFGYSSELIETQQSKFKQNVLFLPASDTAIFNNLENSQTRSGACFYAGKYRDVHGGALKSETQGAVEIFGPNHKTEKPQTPPEVAAIFRSSKIFYSYENTALAMEAVLCGCPAVFLPNEFLTSQIGTSQSGKFGIAWGDDPAEVARATESVPLFQKQYDLMLENYWIQLRHFVQVCVDKASRTEYTASISFAESTNSRGMDDVASPPKKRVGKVISLGLLGYRLIQVDGFLQTICAIFKETRTGGKVTLKRFLKDRYYRHRTWIRSQLN